MRVPWGRPSPDTRPPFTPLIANHAATHPPRTPRGARSGWLRVKGLRVAATVAAPRSQDHRDHGARLGGSPWVFHHVTTRRRARAGERLGGLLHAFQNAAKRAKLPADLRPYDLRHTRITRWVATGHNLALLQKAAGHASVRTTMGYVHLTDDDLGVLV